MPTRLQCIAEGDAFRAKHAANTIVEFAKGVDPNGNECDESRLP